MPVKARRTSLGADCSVEFVCNQCVVDPDLQNRFGWNEADEFSYCEKDALGVMLGELVDCCE